MLSQTIRCSRRKTAFTLIEIMVVVVIIGFIGALGTLSVVNKLKDSRKKIARTFVNSTLKGALDLYYADCAMYPSNDQGIDALCKQPQSSPQNWGGPYLDQDPVDPWGRAYRYKTPSDHGNADFDVWSAGEDGIDDTDDDIGNWRQNSTTNA
ncbi:type II secretion system major pseudopilin GspG [Candidatus Sumerlaeota bacterium]|nr:type II secretion system major pseudopilin GspG [Candidatus Sumerlaeota bacterium]